MAATLAPYTVIVPARFASATSAQLQPSTQIYLRRRLLLALVFIAVIVAVVASAGNVLANRGGAPASAPAVRPATVYVVQPGDTLWSIALRFRGDHSQAGFVDDLVDMNGGSALQVGQVITLP